MRHRDPFEIDMNSIRGIKTTSRARLNSRMRSTNPDIDGRRSYSLLTDTVDFLGDYICFCSGTCERRARGQNSGTIDTLKSCRFERNLAVFDSENSR